MDLRSPGAIRRTSHPARSHRFLRPLAVRVERVRRVCRRGAAVPHPSGDDPGVDLYAFGVSLLDERPQRVVGRRVDGCLSPWHGGVVAEAIAATTDLRDDRVHVRCLHRGDKRVDLEWCEQALAEGVDPIGPDFGARRARGLGRRGDHRGHDEDER